jgi:NADPH-dependent ferric siderophore reductase
MQPQETRERPRRPRRRVIAREVRQLSPHMWRVTFEGPDLTDFVWPGPAAHLKLVFPEPGQHTVPLPEPDVRPTSRTYTPRRFDAATHRLDIDFVLHGEGPGSTWAARAGTGDQLVMMGPARGYDIDTNAAWYVIAADESALPATETLLEALPPKTSASVFVEVASADDIRSLAGITNADVRWLTYPVDRNRPGSALLGALSEFVWPNGDGRIYVGCEAVAVRRIRHMLLETAGIEKSWMTTRGYWRLGEVNHTDRDYGEE